MAASEKIRSLGFCFFPDRRRECEEALPRSAAFSWVKDIIYIRRRETDTEVMNK
jgi:hypothetical protein